MKFLAVAALFIATAMAVPSGGSSYYVGGNGGSGNHGGSGDGGYKGGSGSGGSGNNGGYKGGSSSGGSGSGGYKGGSGSGGSGSGGSGSGGYNGGSGNGGSGNGGSSYEICANYGLSGSAQCCDANVLGLLALGCEPPKVEVTSKDGFKKACASEGKQSACCTLPVAGQALVCAPVS